MMLQNALHSLIDEHEIGSDMPPLEAVKIVLEDFLHHTS